jgi:NTP pyrophosphatase (non-canonical NTP hydrolase)
METYIKQALQFEPSEEQYSEILKRLNQPQMIRILHGLIGMTTEVGELFDQFKKHIFYGKPLDTINLAEEIGDADWYRAITVDALSNLLEKDVDELNAHIQSKNISKLTERYKGKFSNEAAINRNVDKERMILESVEFSQESCDCQGNCNCK